MKNKGSSRQFALFQLVVISCASCFGSISPSRANSARGDHGMVSSGQPLATEAGLQVLKRGGNAIDAAVAVGLTLGVVDGQNSGIGGGCIMLIRQASGRIIALDGRETAPLLAKPDMFVRNGRADGNLSQVGALAIATPGALLAYNFAAGNFGKIPLKEHLVRAASLAEAGFALDAGYAERLAESAQLLGAFPESRAIFLHPDGTPLRTGEILRQPDLAKTYRGIARQGVPYFYTGPFAVATIAWMGTHGGILSDADFALYRIGFREPVTTTYRGRAIVGFPPPSSGGAGVAEILNILENFDLKQMGPNSADMIHVVAEAMKLGFADRAFWLGDPEYTRVPRNLAAKPYAAQLAARIRKDHTTPVPLHGVPPAALQNFFGNATHTTHFSTADAAGNWVACTATINTSFGSKVVIPGTGVVMNNEMDDFSAQPGAPNYFGLVGAEANGVAPGKRPLTSMSPTFVMVKGTPILAAGAAGGPTIISQVVLTIINMIDFGMDLETALAQPRFHHQWQPDELRVENRIPPAVIQELERRGHQVVRVSAIGASQAVGVSTDGKNLVGISEPRGYGRAEGW
jgi:gamma-glutamyltranspeptidase/glutathione hydrolase